MNEMIFAQDAPNAVGPYCHAVKCGDTVYTSGQLGLIPATGKLADGVEAQAKQSLANLAAVLSAVDMSLADVVKTTVLLADINDFARVNKIYAEIFGDNRPARSCFQVAALPAGGLIEIECIAVKQ